MSNESPAVILYDNQGHPLGVVLEGIVYKLQAQVTGAAPDGYTVAGNPVLVAGSDGVSTRTLKTNNDGYLQVTVDDLTISDPIVISGNDGINNRIIKTNTDGYVHIVNNEPTIIAGSDGLNIQTIRTDNDGYLQVQTINPITSVVISGSDGITDRIIRTDSDGYLQVQTINSVVVSGSDGITDRIIRTDNDGYLQVQTINPITSVVVSGSDGITDRIIRTDTDGYLQIHQTLGQKTSTNSYPVVIASDQSTLPVSFAESTKKIAYDIGDTTIYIGTAPLGSATNAPVWLIKRTTLVDGEPTFIEWSNSTAIWDDRTSTLYS